MIADTSFLIDLMREDSNAIDKIDQLVKNDIDIIIPAVVIFELYIGLGRLNLNTEEEKRITNVIDNFSITKFSTSHAKTGGINLGILYEKGNPVDPVDAQIAGVALTMNKSVITKNEDHFNQFEKLKIVTYDD